MERMLQSLCSTSKRHSYNCLKHPSLQIITVCNHPQCTQPFLCSECQEAHTSDHRFFLITVKQLYDGSATKRAGSLLSSLKTENLEHTKMVNQTLLNKMKVQINQEIDYLLTLNNTHYETLIAKASHIRDSKEKLEKLTKGELEKSDQLKIAHLRKIVDNYNSLTSNLTVEKDSTSIITKQLSNEIAFASDFFQNTCVPNMLDIFQKKKLDFSKLKVDYNFKIPGSQGVGLAASAYSPEFEILGLGYKEDSKGCFAVWDLMKREIVYVHKDAHRKVIIHVAWISTFNYFITCSHDSTMKVFQVRNGPKLRIDLIKTLRGHNDWIRCLKYVPEFGVLVSGGTGPDIKIWSVKFLKRIATINTSGDGDLDGSLAYIPSKKLIGAGFKTGFIRFYHIITKKLVLSIPTGFSNYYCSGVQYLPKKKLILAHVNYNLTKIWAFNEENNSVVERDSIFTESNVTGCILANEEENQLLLTSVGSYIEIYDILKRKLKAISLGPYLNKTKSPVFISGIKRVSICDLTSENICVLKN